VGGSLRQTITRQAYFGFDEGWLDVPVLERAELNEERDGPCIIEEYDSTCLVPPNARASLDSQGNIVINIL